MVLCPPFSVVAFPHDQKPDQEQRTIDIDGEAHPIPFTDRLGNGRDPAGTAGDRDAGGPLQAGLPIGVQISAPCSKTAPRSLSRGCWSGNSAASSGHRKCNFDLTFRKAIRSLIP